MADLNISNIINISVSAAQRGLGAYNTSNIALFTRDPIGGDFGDDGFKIYLEPSEVATDFGSDSNTADMAVAIFSQQPNILAGSGYLVIIPFLDEDETVEAAITRTQDLVQYFGILATEISSSVDILSAAALVQTLNKIAFWPSAASADVNSGGILDLLRTGSYKKNRGLLYVGTGVEKDALLFAAAYAGRALSTNFSGSNTTQTMQLKDLVTIQPDSGMTQTIYTAALAAGADMYASIQGVPKTLTSGENGFFDDVYNQEWFIGALTVAGFNVLAQNSTKIPQTEAGVDILKGAYRQVCEQAVTNQYSAPGSWTSPTTFGNQADFIRNIGERGYYIYSGPVATQSAVDRAARLAPLVQIALKEAGAIHKANVIVYINA